MGNKSYTRVKTLEQINKIEEKINIDKVISVEVKFCEGIVCTVSYGTNKYVQELLIEQLNLKSYEIVVKYNTTINTYYYINQHRQLTNFNEYAKIMHNIAKLFNIIELLVQLFKECSYSIRNPTLHTLLEKIKDVLIDESSNDQLASFARMNNYYTPKLHILSKYITELINQSHKVNSECLIIFLPNAIGKIVEEYINYNYTTCVCLKTFLLRSFLDESIPF